MSETLSRGDAVYGWVRDRIIDGTLLPGSRIRERDLADELGVSRVPIREAFPRLEAEGYIKTIPRRGAVVAQMELADVVELFDVRAALEVLAARLAATRCAAGVSGESLELALVEAEAVIAGEDTQHIAQVTTDFHDAIVQLSGNSMLEALMLPIRGRVKRLFNIAHERDDLDLHREHRELCDAIVQGRVELAAALALAHVEHSRAETMPIIERLINEA